MDSWRARSTIFLELGHQGGTERSVTRPTMDAAAYVVWQVLVGGTAVTAAMAVMLVLPAPSNEIREFVTSKTSVILRIHKVPTSLVIGPLAAVPLLSTHFHQNPSIATAIIITDNRAIAAAAAAALPPAA
jgi:hypothetical protein